MVGQMMLDIAKFWINHQTWSVIVPLIFMTGINAEFYKHFTHKKKLHILLHIGLVAILFVSAFLRYEDLRIRTAPYAVVSNSQQEENVESVQVIVYHEGDTYILEQATIETLDNGISILTINTSQQETADNTSLSYEYQPFDIVIIE